LETVDEVRSAFSTIGLIGHDQHLQSSLSFATSSRNSGIFLLKEPLVLLDRIRQESPSWG
jgi:hypothetical protein